jgi:hypothetical protein
MKKSLLLISLMAFLFLFSCKKDEKTDPFNTAYTDETVEQSKTNVEQNAVNLVDQLDALSSANGIKVIQHLYDLETANTQKSTLKNRVFQPLSLVSLLSDKNMAPKVLDGMKLTSEIYESDPVKLSALFDSIAGKYTYNFATSEFDRTELADQVVFEFPGLEGDLTNTAVLTVSNFSVAEIGEPIEDWPSGLANELPASLKVDLRYNGKSLAGVTFTASYKNDGMPTRVSLEIFVDDFKFITTAVHSPYTSASWTNTLKFKDDILFETYIAANGDWSEENISNSTVETEQGTETHIEDIIRNANAHVILMNLNVIGKVNLKPMGDSIRAIEDRGEQMTREDMALAEVDAINANARLIVIYRDSNKKIAEAEAYVSSEWDDYKQEYDYSPAMRFVYADSSKVDIETYVNSELDNFYASLNEFIDKLNSEYDLSINHVNGTEVK